MSKPLSEQEYLEDFIYNHSGVNFVVGEKPNEDLLFVSDVYPEQFNSMMKELTQFVMASRKAYGEQAREPLVRILEKADYQKCTECGDFYHDDDMTFCEPCDDAGAESGMHEWCAGYIYNGDGEYPAESAYALCKKHSQRNQGEKK